VPWISCEKAWGKMGIEAFPEAWMIHMEELEK
jgi:hypothetical protein